MILVQNKVKTSYILYEYYNNRLNIKCNLNRYILLKCSLYGTRNLKRKIKHNKNKTNLLTVLSTKEKQNYLYS